MALLTSDIQEKLIDLLVSEGLVRQEVIDEANAEVAQTNKPLFSILAEKHIVDDELLAHAIAQVSGVPYVNLSNSIIDQKVLSLLAEDIAERFMAVPLAEVQNRLAVAMIDANNVQAVDYLANLIQRPIKVFMASEAGVRHVLDQYRTDLSSVDAAAEASQAEANQDSAKDIKTLVQDSPISRALSTILEYAVKSRASDVHIEPLEKTLKIRCRVDGVLREIMQLPKSIEPALVSRIKILSNLKIDEHRIPQDGQFTVGVANKEVDLRIAISPVISSSVQSRYLWLLRLECGMYSINIEPIFRALMQLQKRHRPKLIKTPPRISRRLFKIRRLAAHLVLFWNMQ